MSRTTNWNRRTGAAVAALATLGALAGCAQIPASDSTSTCTPTAAFPVEVTGDGSGPVITDDGIATFTVSIADQTGAVLVDAQPASTLPDGSAAPVRVGSVWPGLIESLRCASAGETVQAELRNDQFYTPDYLAQTGIAPDETYRYTMTVDKVYHSAASGRIAPQRNGIPAVVNAEGGVGVTMPNEPAPTELRVAQTITGFGPEVAEGDLVVVQLSTFDWSTGRPGYSSWSETGAAQFVAATAASADNFYGVAGQLVGVPIGSQVVVVAPASQLATQPGPFGAGYGNGDAVVFVFDVLGTL